MRLADCDVSCACRSLIASDALALSAADWASALGDSIIPLVSAMSEHSPAHRLLNVKV